MTRICDHDRSTFQISSSAHMGIAYLDFCMKNLHLIGKEKIHIFPKFSVCHLCCIYFTAASWIFFGANLSTREHILHMKILVLIFYCAGVHVHARGKEANGQRVYMLQFLQFG